MIIIEARGRGGQLLERIRSDKPVIKIGRAYDNDLILEDEYVSPHHLKVIQVEDGWQFEDIGSLNGSRRKAPRSANGLLRSGDELRVGHTTLHVYDAHHPVEAALKMDGAEARLSSLGRHGVWFSLVLVSVAVAALTLYRNSFDEFRPLTVLEPIITGVLAMFAIAAFWALVGRLLRHKGHFFAHLSVWLIFGLFDTVTTFIAQSVAYNANSQLLEKILQESLSFGLLALAVWGSFTLATNLRATGRVYAAIGVAVVFLAIGLASQFRFEREFSAQPDYYVRLKSPALLWVKPVGEERVADELSAVFDRADIEAEKGNTDELTP